MTTSVPGRATLETRRLVLSPMAKRDLASFHRQWNDAEVGRYLWDGKPVPMETVEAVLAASDDAFTTSGYGLWSLRLRQSVDAAEPLGFSGLRVPEGQAAPELLFALDRSCWSRGFAAEASAEVLRWALGRLGHPVVTAAANPGNTASHRVLLRLGFTRTGLVKTEIEELYTYALRREDLLSTEARPPARMVSP
jgi:RimJ/RimL family protein N-acetyltransferase